MANEITATLLADTFYKMIDSTPGTKEQKNDWVNAQRTTGYLRRDDSGHWYAIPDTVIEAFDDAQEQLEGKEYMDAADDFDSFEAHYGEYRLGGSYTDVKVLIED